MVFVMFPFLMIPFAVFSIFVSFWHLFSEKVFEEDRHHVEETFAWVEGSFLLFFYISFSVH